MRRACEHCGVEFVPANGKARYCSTRCRQRAHAARKAAGTSATVAPVVRLTVATLPDTGTVADGLRVVLAPLGLLADPRARTALVLAARLDDGAGESGSSLAAVARTLDGLLVALLTGRQEAAPDPVDELEARRAARLSD